MLRLLVWSAIAQSFFVVAPEVRAQEDLHQRNKAAEKFQRVVKLEPSPGGLGLRWYEGQKRAVFNKGIFLTILEPVLTFEDITESEPAFPDTGYVSAALEAGASVNTGGRGTFELAASIRLGYYDPGSAGIYRSTPIFLAGARGGVAISLSGESEVAYGVLFAEVFFSIPLLFL